MRVKTGIFVLILILSLIYSVSALSVYVENTRMVLRLSPGESTEKYFYLKNKNDVSVNVNLSVSGDLAAVTILKDNSFTLLPGQDKKAYFIISPKISGTFETNIGITYSTSGGEKDSIITTIIVISENESTSTDNKRFKINFPSLNINFSSLRINLPSINIKKLLPNDASLEFTPLNLMYLSTGALALILAILLIYLFRINNKLNKRRIINHA